MRVFAAVLVMLATAVIVHAAIWGGPALWYKLRQPSVRSECDAVHSGMTLAELDNLVHAKGAPTDESLVGNHLSFGQWDSCDVELDPSTMKVTQVRVVPARLGGDH